MNGLVLSPGRAEVHWHQTPATRSDCTVLRAEMSRGESPSFCPITIAAVSWLRSGRGVAPVDCAEAATLVSLRRIVRFAVSRAVPRSIGESLARALSKLSPSSPSVP